MKHKITVHCFAYDDGTGCQIFATEAALHARLVNQMIQHRSAWETAEEEALDPLIEAGRVEEAWEYWVEHCCGHMDTYSIDSQEIEIDLPEPINLINALRLCLARLEEYPDAAGGIALEGGHRALASVTTAVPAVPARCSECVWIDEADSTLGTSFKGVGLCPTHAANHGPALYAAAGRLEQAMIKLSHCHCQRNAQELANFIQGDLVATIYRARDATQPTQP